MWESRLPFGEISKGLVGRVGSLPLAFHSSHSPAISTALFFLWLRLRASLAAVADQWSAYCGPGSFFFLLFFSR
jgi:hypothetical protein